MTHFDYYATSGDKFSRAVQYGGYPLAQLAGLALFQNNTQKANVFAKVVSSGLYASLTTTFLARETNMIDTNARDAVAAEMGIDPEKVKFSDYKHSQNVIAKKAYEDVISLQKWRYGTDMMFLMPLVAQFVYKTSTGHDLPVSRLIKNNDHAPISQKVADSAGWNMGVYGAKAAYWGFETFLLDKSGHYEIVKLRENLESTGKDMSTNDLLGVFQRTRMNDRKLPKVETKEEYDMLRPLLKQMADAYNKHDGKFGMSEILYLIGSNKINIHAEDNKTLSADAAQRSKADIERVISLGLTGIGKENRKRNEEAGFVGNDGAALMNPTSFTDSVTNTAVGLVQNILGKNSKLVPKRAEEWVTVRDPGELTNWNGTDNHRARG